ncbi:MAG: hypothetical protein J0M16_08145 [Gammaproteobacteria bacterium]|nr:hypothetical protein [Gammaproteobacteria bacterium]
MTELGSVVWSGKEPAWLDLSLDAASLEESGNRLRLRAEKVPNGKPSLVFLDRHTLTYPARLAAHDGEAWLNPSSDGPHTIPGFGTPDVTVLDVTQPRRPGVVTGVHVRSSDSGGFNATFAARAGRRYLAFEPAGVTVVTSLATALRPSLRLTRNRADYLIVSPTGLLDAAREFADHRRIQGLTTLVVPLTSVADEFGAGVATPGALREFLRVAAKTWSLPPKYVLLLGDGTYDYRDLTGAHDNLVPPTLLPTGWGLYASDALGGDVDGDGRIEVSVGRLPVTSLVQARQMLAKIRAFEGALPTGRREALLLADQPDASGDFTAGAEVLRGLLSPGFNVATAYRSELGSTAAVRQRLRQALSGDLDYLSYTGHGGHDRFGGSGYLLSSEVPGIGNAGFRLPVVSAMTCAVGNFAVPGNDPLAEHLVLAPDRGAIAVWSPSGLSLDSKAQVLARLFADALAGARPGARLGDLLRDSMNTYRAGAGDLETLVIYNLLGDPGLRVRR